VYGALGEAAPEHCLYWPAHDRVVRQLADRRPMNAEFNWWLLIVGLVIGAALTWLIMADAARREQDVEDAERADEAVWIAKVLTESGRPVTQDRVAEVLGLHRDYLGAPPPDEPAADDPEPISDAAWPGRRPDRRRPSDLDEIVDSRG
jgi:hypothetical protein